ncbi:hypothetical protein H0274_11465 [Altererythrobacter sp. CC-YST694]|uniref:hypothetical protein n=1 Tax=Altererythrobacter sp. CC-YST694 TaxID=2755038 RepID=UPI001D00AE47|nr:hypothetical protein [Altererythrobacter sp. CC-YST694]MCB5425879.1 hypothetical protein [Altererythrobacter sp. CC-YST694]
MIRNTIVALAGLALLAGCGEKQPEMASVRDLMKNEVQPTAEIYWGSAGAVSDENGITDLTPTTEEGWQKARDAATKLGELGKKMMEPEYSKDRGEAWIRLSQGLIDVSKVAEKAAADKNPDKVFEVGGTIYDVCTACHQAYPQSEAPPAEGEGAAAAG